MAEITKVYRQSMESTRFIGKKYGDNDRVDGGFGAKWDEWFSHGWFDIIKSKLTQMPQPFARTAMRLSVCSGGKTTSLLNIGLGFSHPKIHPFPMGINLLILQKVIWACVGYMEMMCFSMNPNAAAGLWKKGLKS